MIICDAKGVVRYHDQGHGGDRPEISRNALTGLLLSGVPEEVFQWETKVLSVVPSSSSSGKQWNITSQKRSSTPTLTSSTEAEEEEEETHEFDLVIGADGAWSKARASLPGATTPFYSGVSAITLTLRNLSTHAPLNSLLGAGSFWACAPRRTLIAQRGSHDSARIYLMLASPSETYLQDNGLTGLTGEELATKLLDHESPKPESTPEVEGLITTACLSEPGIIEAKPLYMLPPSNTWTHTPGLTLIGDAAHLMTPFAGEGVNCAMLDALELSKAIISTSTSTSASTSASTASNQSTDDLDKAIEVFEIRMWRRNGGIAEDTYGNLKVIFEDERAPEGIVKVFESHGGVVDLMTMGF
ncbi:Monooxygenase, partial [Lachnellula subtilissima]